MTEQALDKIIKDTVTRILSAVQPKQVFLFGSAARGRMHENSDIDLLVVVPTGLHRRKTAQSIYRNMIGVGFAADIIVVTEEDMETYRDTDGLVIKPALAEGKLIYAA